MANTITLKTSSYNGRYMQVTCTQVMDIASNSSTINWTLSSIGGSVNYYDTGATELIIGGKQVYYKARVAWSSQVFPAAKGSVSGSLTISHNSAGEAAIGVSLTTAIYTTTKRTASDTWTLDTIPRGAKVLTAPDFTDEESPTITYSNPAGANVDKLEACITLANGIDIIVPYREISKTGSSYQFVFNDGELDGLHIAAQNTNALEVRFYLRTTIDGEQYLQSLPAIMEIVNAQPQIEDWSIIDTLQDTVELTRDETTIIKGHNLISINIKPYLMKDAAFASCLILNGSQRVEALMEDDGYCYATMQNVMEDEFNVIVTDTRGNFIDTFYTLNFVNYVDVTSSQEVSIELIGEAEAAINIKLSGSYYNGDFEGSDNDYYFYYRYAENGGQYTDWIEFDYSGADIYDNSTYEALEQVSGLNYNSTYTIQCRAADMLTEAITTEYTVKLVPVFDWSENDFNFNVPVTFEGSTMTDFVIEEGTEAMGSNGTWYWRKWKNGKAECWGTRNYGNMGVSAFGYLYASTNFSQALPSGLFTAAPDYLKIEVVKGGNGAWVTQGVGTDISSSTTGIFRVCNAASGTLSQVHLSFYAIGRWK